MKVEIKTVYGQNVFEMEDDKAFELLKYAHENRKVVEENVETTPDHVYADWRQGGKEVQTDDEYSFAYKGFLYVKCSACGATRGFNAKIGRTEFKCDECGHSTKMVKMRPVHVHCRCGADFTYKTNIEDKEFSMECINCHATVDLNENISKTCYVTKVDDSAEAEQRYYGSQMARMNG